MNIESLYNIFSQLQADSSRTGKERILEENESNTEFREALSFLLNPYIVTGISTKKINKKIEKPQSLLYPATFGALINYIKQNNSGRDKDILAIRAYIETLESDELRTFVKQFVTKDLKLGLSEKTVNKVYGAGTIPSFSVMLAESYEKKEAKVKGKFYITLKLDGNRCVAIKENGKVKFFTRKGQAIEGMLQLEKEFEVFPDNMVYDGELLLVNKDELPSDELFRATQKVVRKDGEKKDLEFHVFDALPVSEFKTGKSKKKYSQRRETLDFIFSEVIHARVEPVELNFIKILPVLYEGEDKAVISVLMKWAEENGYEGLMVNTANGLYVNKRTADLLKVKKFKTADLLCMNFEKAIDGQFKGIMARINVEYKGNLVGVGSGFTIEEREYFTANPDEIVGKIVEVQFFEESKDEKTGQPSLRFPTFKGIRQDKGVEDINYGE